MLPGGGVAVDVCYGGATWLKNSDFLSNQKFSKNVAIHRVTVQKFK